MSLYNGVTRCNEIRGALDTIEENKTTHTRDNYDMRHYFKDDRTKGILLEIKFNGSRFEADTIM